MATISKDLILEFVSVLNQMRESQDIYDITLSVQEREVRGNRLLLSVISMTLREIFESHRDQSYFSFKNIDADALEMIIECSFKFSFQPLRITELNLENVLRTGINLGCRGILEEACRYIEKNTKLSNCMKYQRILWQFINDESCLTPADSSLLGIVLKYVTFFISKNFAAVSVTDCFKVANAPEVVSIIAIDDLNVKSEDVVLAAVRGWYKADPENHHLQYLQLLKHIRWPLLTKTCLEDASNDEAIWNCPDVQELIRKSFQYQLRDADNRGSINFGANFYLTPRRGMLHHHGHSHR
ncbi:hypothetical protein RvY_13514 [Ramazzottius varieornatus]|uniref:BTB domain-containing protein n=1 Tax=Ramazzottius varieornatus TaxID=947166 RepID=A0A1D1VN60_RAMVA|nr:hypothetical protein RvY_13514 [Ramazzottius varieornatus]